jgi:hypothetical protein
VRAWSKESESDIVPGAACAKDEKQKTEHSASIENIPSTQFVFLFIASPRDFQFSILNNQVATCSLPPKNKSSKKQYGDKQPFVRYAIKEWAAKPPDEWTGFPDLLLRPAPASNPDIFPACPDDRFPRRPDMALFASPAKSAVMLIILVMAARTTVRYCNLSYCRCPVAIDAT